MKRKRIALLLWIVAVGALAPARLHADTYPRQPNVDVLRYAFRITLSDTTDEIVGEATVELRFLAAGVTEFQLDLIGKSADGKGMTVGAVTSAGAVLQFQHEKDRLRITLPAPSNMNEVLAVTITYHGIPAGGLMIKKNSYGDRGFFSNDWPDGARNWLPTIDHPYDKAACEMTVIAPAHYQVISNGRLIEATDLPEGMRRTTWRESVPIATWLYSLGVARFAVEHQEAFRGIPVETWVESQDRDAGFRDLGGPTKSVLEYFSDRIGPYSYEKLANVQAHVVPGGMELASSIFYGYSAPGGKAPRDWRSVVIHEIAHQWFGDSVTERDWDDVWLSEGFATYFTLLYIEHADGRDAFVAGLKRSREQVFAFDAQHPDYTVIHRNLSNMKEVLSGQIYQKGGWTLHMLRGLIGDENYWAGIREYYRRYQNSNASTDDFRQVMEQVSGKDLAWFFREWLNRGGTFKLQGNWRYNAQAKQLEIEVTQKQDGDAFEMPIQLGITLPGESRMQIETIVVSKKRQSFMLPLAKEPTSVVLDPNTWVLMQAEFTKQN
jgi:aminopeptidase N